MITNHLHSVSNYATSVFKDRLLSNLSNLNYRIILIATLALGCLTLCYTRFVKRRVVSFDGTIREGIVVWGKLEGPGRKIFPDGETMIGNFEDDELQGEGQISWSDGTHYRGPFEHGVPQRKRTRGLNGPKVISDEICLREGEVTNGKLNGLGVKTFPNGKMMIGNFENDELHGEGQITFPDKTICKGHFEHGQWINVTIYYPNGIIKQGRFQDGELHGEGGKIIRHGKVIEGTFRNGELDGQGIITSHNGIWRGTFKGGQLNGKGEIIIEDTIYRGNFVQNQLTGPGEISKLDGTIIERGFYIAGVLQDLD